MITQSTDLYLWHAGYDWDLLVAWDQHQLPPDTIRQELLADAGCEWDLLVGTNINYLLIRYDKNSWHTPDTTGIFWLGPTSTVCTSWYSKLPPKSIDSLIMWTNVDLSLEVRSSKADRRNTSAHGLSLSPICGYLVNSRQKHKRG